MSRSPLTWLIAVLVAAGSFADHGGVVGIDVSHHTGTVDWKRIVSQGIAFAIVKATEGIDDADPMFDTHWRELGELGLPRGAYHFYVTEDDPEAQARFFLSRARLGPGDLRPVVDLELIGHGTSGELAEPVQRFLDIVERELGVAPIIYTSPRFWNAHLDASFGRYPLWIAEYGVEAPQVPSGWERWTLWQFEQDAPLPGSEKGVDRSRLHPHLDLTALLIPAPATDEP